jgi:hypothetical protein
MPPDRSALIDQLRELLTEQRHDSVVIHNYWRSTWMAKLPPHARFLPGYPEKSEN